jgi:hypothetical protein
MAGIIIPGDRTSKQPARGYCTNPECRESNLDSRFEFDLPHDRLACPKCGADRQPLVGLLALVHLLVRDKAGPVRGVGGLRYKLACDEKRAYLATVSNQEAATGDVRAANCPGCLRAVVNLPRQDVMALSIK